MYRSEAEKVKPIVLSYLTGKTVLDLGCGAYKVVPWAVGVDDCSEHGTLRPDVIASVDPSKGGLYKALVEAGKPTQFDTVFASHILEHVWAPIGEALRYWFNFVKPGGHLILYTPDEMRYKYDPSRPWTRNPAHTHLITHPVLLWHLQQVKGAEIVMHAIHDGEDLYSIISVLRKKE